jgi:hypothetical protein
MRRPWAASLARSVCGLQLFAGVGVAAVAGFAVERGCLTCVFAHACAAREYIMPTYLQLTMFPPSQALW